MRNGVRILGCLSWIGLSVASPGAGADGPSPLLPVNEIGLRGGGAPAEPPTLLLPRPWTLELASLGDEVDCADVTDLEVADFNADGCNDVAIAWYATDLEDAGNNLRRLSVYFGCGTGSFVHGADYDLYIRNEQFEALSVFRNGPADIGRGDFDGDGDPDLAVTPFFGDELWLLENLGDGTFAQHLKYPFDFNTTGNFQTPPEACAADFDGDGRDELVYIADPIQYIQGDTIHIWRTSGSIADMDRVSWEGIGEVTVQWTRGLAIADFDTDGRPDLCFSGSVNPPEEDEPVLVFWHGLDTATRRFAVEYLYPSFLCADVVAVQPDPACPPGVLLTDLDGTRIEHWAAECTSPMSFQLVDEVSGYAGYAVNRGMTAVPGDVNGDGLLDLVTRQKLGAASDTRQVEVTLYHAACERWERVGPTNPLNSAGFEDLPYSEILRPRNLAVADLWGNTLPEVLAGFGPAVVANAEGQLEEVLRVAIWRNSCIGDVTRDGRAGMADLCALLAALGAEGPPLWNPEADLNKDGEVGLADLSILLGDYGCDCRANSMPPADLE
jgi:hypothetical protein